MQMIQNEPATPKQLNYLKTLCAERGLDLANTDRPYATKAQASELISYVLTLPRAPRQPAQVNPAGEITRKATPDADLTPGVYELDGVVYVVKKARESGNLYANRIKEIDGERQTEAGTVINMEFEYARGVIFRLTEAHRMTVERAMELTLRYGRCIACGRELKAAQSVEQGIGPVCIKKFAGWQELQAAAKAAVRAKKAKGGRSLLSDVSDERVAELEREGMTHSDAIGAAMGELMAAGVR